MTRSSRTYEFGAFRLDLVEHCLFRDGRPVPLTPKVFELLRLLVENAGHLVDKGQLLQEVWPDTFVEEANLNRAVSVLRKVLGETEANPYIETVPKRGYRFVAPVRGGDLPTGVPARRRAWLVPVAATTTAVVTMAGMWQMTRHGEQNAGASVSSGPSIHRQLTFTGKELTPAVSPDGRRIAFVSNESSERRVFVRDLDGGEPVLIFTAPNAGWLRWSPDGTELLFWASGNGTDGLYISPLSPGSARRITRGGHAIACWSPDGSTIAHAQFVSARIRFLNKLGEVQRSISLQGIRGWIWDLDWSVEGHLLFVADDEDRRPAVWTIRSDGSEQMKRLTAPGEVLAARWAPGGSAFYYFRRVNQTVSLYKAPVDAAHRIASGEPAPLLSGLETDGEFSISADATRLVYARAPYFSNLWTVEADDSHHEPSRVQQLTSGTAVIERPRVSPDGATILFTMGYESRMNVYTMPAQGGTPKQLTFLRGFSLGGVWSPDGRSIAFASDEGGVPRVWTVNADGSAARPLPSSNLSDSMDLAWAPGARIMYQQSGNRNYHVVDPADETERTLIHDSSHGWIGSAVYSPDGKRIAVWWNRPPERALGVIDAESSKEKAIQLLSSDSEATPIGWSPDGQFVYVLDGKRATSRGPSVPYEMTVAEPKILRVSVTGETAETLLQLPFAEVGSIAVFPNGRRFVCTVYSSTSDVWVVEQFDALPVPVTVARSR